MQQPVFTAEKNPLDETKTVIYEIKDGIKNYRFQVETASFHDDIEYDNFIEYLVNILNKKFTI